MKRILIVEDDLDIQELLDAYLRDAGYDTVLASDGVEAVSYTHLDVYKRQVYGRAARGPGGDRAV